MFSGAEASARAETLVTAETFVRSETVPGPPTLHWKSAIPRISILLDCRSSMVESPSAILELWSTTHVCRKRSVAIADINLEIFALRMPFCGLPQMIAQPSPESGSDDCEGSTTPLSESA